MRDYQANKALVLDYYNALQAATAATVGGVVARYTSDDYLWRGVHPFNELGRDAVINDFWGPFYRAWRPAQRRQDVFIAGASEVGGGEWVISMGHFMGLLNDGWLGLPASRKIVLLRYADFNRVTDGKISETGFFCDLIGLMQQLGLQPLPQQTGSSFIYPGPRTHDGLLFEAQDGAESEKTLALVNRMINDLDELNKSGVDRCPPEYLAKTWRDDMIWYGPAGIGATYGIAGFQAQHQIPFRVGLTGKTYNGHVCRFAEGCYAGFFGWPNLTNTPVGGFLGLPGNEARINMRVVDVYRRDGDKLAENWVFIDLLHWLKQQGLDILQRTEQILRG